MNENVSTKNKSKNCRLILGEALPLEAPLLIQIFPVYACNFRCNYCLNALPKSRHGFISDKIFMDFELYKKCIDDISSFDTKIKMLRFAGIGEPLMHNEIAQMVGYAKEKGVAESVDIVTNGVLLNPELSLALIEAGLDRLRISIQGVNEKKYHEISNTKIDYSKLVENLKFFYENRGKTRVYIKIIDCAISSKDEQELFFETFEQLCDTIAIEHLTPTVEGIDYNKMSKGKDLNITQNGNEIIDTNICPQPFYMLQINPDGNVVPCCSMKYPIIIGNAKEDSIVNIWNGDIFSRFRRSMLDGTKSTGNVCLNCSLYKYGIFKEDVLDSYADRLKNIY